MLQLRHEKPRQWLVREYQITSEFADYRKEEEYPI